MMYYHFFSIYSLPDMHAVLLCYSSPYVFERWRSDVFPLPATCNSGYTHSAETKGNRQINFEFEII